MTPPGDAGRRVRRTPLILAGIAVLLVAAITTVVAVLAAGAGRTPVAAASRPASSAATSAPTPTPSPTPTPTPVAAALCDLPGVAQALGQQNDTAAIAAMGGADAVRAAVAAGTAPCVNLADPTSVWVVVDKLRPLQPASFTPPAQVSVPGVRNLVGSTLRADAAAAMSAMVAAARAAGTGDMAILSSYRSYGSQVRTYNSHVASQGKAAADRGSARPGYSEHQSGLAADLVACGGSGCGGLDGFGATAQGRWIAANSWRFGFIVRYEAGQEPITGYDAEPWHVRFIGVPLATAYHDLGFHALETFWGLPPAPDYAG